MRQFLWRSESADRLFMRRAMHSSMDAVLGVKKGNFVQQVQNGEHVVQEVDTRTLVILAFSATAGVLVEFYDFTIFGFAAASAFPNVFFPKLPATQALVFSYLAYAAGHPARLLGAFIFGHFGDRSGRKFAFLINIVVVGASTCLTGLLQGYRTIGIAAPILLVLLRIIQGIGVGG